jgi:hypothetical protein
MSLPSRLLGANPSIQVSTLLSGSLSTPSAKGTFFSITDSYESIATYTVTSSDTEINFTSIPATYKHLQIRALVKGGRTIGNDGWSMQFNSDATSGNYSYHYFRLTSPGIAKNSGGGSSNAIELGEIIGNYANANDKFTICVADIIDYANTTKFKIVRSIGGYDQDGTTAGNADTDMINWYGSTWESTSAVNSIKLLCSNGLRQYSIVSLYGIKG